MCIFMSEFAILNFGHFLFFVFQFIWCHFCLVVPSKNWLGALELPSSSSLSLLQLIKFNCALSMVIFCTMLHLQIVAQFSPDEKNMHCAAFKRIAKIATSKQKLANCYTFGSFGRIVNVMYTQIGMQIERAQFRFYVHTNIFPMNDLSAKQRTKKKYIITILHSTLTSLSTSKHGLLLLLLLLLVPLSMFIFCTNK